MPVRQRHFFDRIIRIRPLTGQTVIHIVIISIGIGADAANVMFPPQVLVRYTRGYNNHISFFYPQRNPRFTSELQAGFSGIKTQHFVCGTVVMMLRENTVFPAVVPMIVRKKVTNEKCRKEFGEPQYIPVNQYRKLPVIGKYAIIIQKITLYRICLT